MADGIVIRVTTVPPKRKNPPSVAITVNGTAAKGGQGTWTAPANAYNSLHWHFEGAASTTFEILAEPNAEAKKAGLELKMGADKNGQNPITGSINRSGIAADTRHFWLE